MSETFATLSVTNVFSLPSYSPAICCLLAGCSGPAEPWEDSNNPHSLLLVSVTSLQAPQQLHFHLWLLRTPDPVTAGSAGRQGAYIRLFPRLLSLPPLSEEDSEVPLPLCRHRSVGVAVSFF